MAGCAGREAGGSSSMMSWQDSEAELGRPMWEWKGERGKELHRWSPR